MLVLISHKIRLFAFKCIVKDDEICIFVKVKILIVLVFDRELCIQLLYFVLGRVCAGAFYQRNVSSSLISFSLSLSLFNIYSTPL